MLMKLKGPHFQYHHRVKALSIPVYFKNGRPSFFPPFSIKKPQPITPYGALSSKYFYVSPAHLGRHRVAILKQNNTLTS